VSPAATVTRVNYSEGQLLSAADLTDEQHYLVEMRRRHAAGNHTWGIAHGLELSIQGAALRVGPGTAVDGFGRHLIVPEGVLTHVDTLQADEIAVWLVFALERAGNTRWREVTRLRLVPGPVGDPRQQPAAGSSDWPVFLGVIRRPGPGKDYVPDAASIRPLIGLVGETVQAASGAAQIRSGADFAVGLAAGPDRLRIGPAGNLTITANASFAGNFHLQPDSGLTPSGRVGVGFEGSGAPPAAAAPWRIYRATVPPANELVVEIRGPQDKEDPNGLTAAIGMAAAGVFKPRLTVASNGDVTVDGSLRVAGQVIESPIPADPSDPRFLVALVNASAGATTDAPGPLSVAMRAPDTAKVGAVAYTLTFTNAAVVAVEVIGVQEFVTLNGQLAPGPGDPFTGFSLNALATRSIDRSVNAAAPGTLSIGVNVLAVGAGGAALSAKNGKQIKVT
jgi:hypothetical protein